MAVSMKHMLAYVSKDGNWLKCASVYFSALQFKFHFNFCRFRVLFHIALQHKWQKITITLITAIKLTIVVYTCAGSGTLLPGMEIGVGTMRMKEKSRFLIRAEYAFGDKGCPPRIPENATCE